MSRPVLLGVPIDSVSRGDTVARLREFLASGAQHHVATPNAEMLVEASGNTAFRTVLQSTALNLPDSQGLVWILRLRGHHISARVTGVDTTIALCQSLTDAHPVFLLGAGEGIAERAAHALHFYNPRLKIAGTHAGSPREEDAAGIIEQINASGAHLLLVAYGAPAQEFWIAQHLQSMPQVRVAMGVGGTFDFLAGVQVRAPGWMRSIGLEWLWRFAKEPSRWRRMWRAVVVFPILALTRGASPRR